MDFDLYETLNLLGLSRDSCFFMRAADVFGCVVCKQRTLEEGVENRFVFKCGRDTGAGMLLAAIKVTPLNERRHFSIGYRAREHPETTIGMHPSDAVRAKDLHGVLDTPGNFVRRFDGVIFDVHHANSQGDAGAEFSKNREFLVTAPGEFEHEMIDFEAIQESEQAMPITALNGLSTIIAETKVNGFLATRRFQHMIDRFMRPGGVFEMARDVRFVHLNHRGIDGFDLPSQYFREIHA
jgi:hypothetical protein